MQPQCGLIDEKGRKGDARNRPRQISMEPWMCQQVVRGDAIAGIVITIVNVIGVLHWCHAVWDDFMRLGHYSRN